MKLTLCIVRYIVFTTYIIVNAFVPKQVDIGLDFSRIHDLSLLRCFISDHWHKDE